MELHRVKFPAIRNFFLENQTKLALKFSPNFSIFQQNFGKLSEIFIIILAAFQPNNEKLAY